MLKAIQLKDYGRRVSEKLIETWYDPKYMWYHGCTGGTIERFPDSNINQHCFVSVDDEDNLIGFISYEVDWEISSTSHWVIISFDMGNMSFLKDVYRAICDVFTKYGLKRMVWSCYEENPAVDLYREFVQRYGGRECAHFRNSEKLMDGKLHDEVYFEILDSEFLKKKENTKKPNQIQFEETYDSVTDSLYRSIFKEFKNHEGVFYRYDFIQLIRAINAKLEVVTHVNKTVSYTCNAINRFLEKVPTKRRAEFVEAQIRSKYYYIVTRDNQFPFIVSEKFPNESTVKDFIAKNRDISADDLFMTLFGKSIPHTVDEEDRLAFTAWCMRHDRRFLGSVLRRTKKHGVIFYEMS